VISVHVGQPGRLHHQVVSSKTHSDHNVFWVLATPEAVEPEVLG
jgi:hypothetical protein